MIEKLAEFIYKTFFFFLPEGHPWDYLAHFIVSFAVVSALFFILRAIHVRYDISLIAAVCVLVCIAFVKEINDFRIGKHDIAGDMIANFLGIAAAIALILLITKPQS